MEGWRSHAGWSSLQAAVTALRETRLSWSVTFLSRPRHGMADFNASTPDDNVPTKTSVEQSHTEDVCFEVFEDWLNADGTLARERCAKTQ